MPEARALDFAGDLGPWLIAGAAASTVLHIYVATMLAMIAQKTCTPSAWRAWFPLLNLFLVCEIARKSILWGFLLLVPCVSPIAVVVLGMGMARQRGAPSWTGLLWLVPIVNLIWLAWLALSPGPRFVLCMPYGNLPLSRATRLTGRDVPPLAAQAWSIVVAEVVPNPNEPKMLGLKNLSPIPWPATMEDGAARTVPPGKSLRLAKGVCVQWGGSRIFIDSVATGAGPRRLGGAALALVGGCLILSAIAFGFAWSGWSAKGAPHLKPFGPDEQRQLEADLRNKSFEEFATASEP